MDIFEDLTWTMFKMSGGNPYIIQDLVQGRNLAREKNTRKTKTKEERTK